GLEDTKNNLNFDVAKDATLTVSGRIQADGKSTEQGQITKKGDGTLVLTAYNFYDGGTTISGGTLRTADMANLGTGAISIATGARLEITAQSGTVAKAANITGGGTLALTFAQDSSLTVSGFAGGLDISGKGTLKMGSGSSLKENVRVSNGATLAFDSTGKLNENGKTLSVNGGVVDFGATSQTMGSWKLELAGGAHLKGAGEKDNAMYFNVTDSTISVTSGENTISATTQLRTNEGNLNLNYNVSKDATLTVRGLIQADGNTPGYGSITKLGEGTLVLTGANTYAGTTAVEEGALHINSLSALGSSSVWLVEGAKLRIENTTDPMALASDKIKGFGTLELLLSTEYGNTLSLGTSFGGETYIRGGNMTLNGAQAGKALRLADNANLQFNEKETAAWAGNLVLEGKSEVRANDGSDFTLNGSVSGSGTYVSQGAGKVNFKGDVTLAGFEQTSGNDFLVANFNGTTKIGSVKVSKGAVYLNGKTELGTMTISGGTVQIANEVKLNGTDNKVPMDIEAGGRLLLADGAVLNRTTNVSSWIRGSLVVLKDAKARLVSKEDDVHVSYYNGSNKGTIRLEENSSLEIDVYGLYFYAGNKVELESGSELTLTQSSASISNSGAETTTLIASNVGETSSQQYGMKNENFELTAGHLKAVSSEAAELGNKLTRSSLENAGTGTLTVKNAANTITSLKATGGDVMLTDDMSVQRISAAKDKSVSVAADKGITMAGGVSLKAGGTEATLTALSDSALAGLQDGTSFTIRDMVLQHATLTASNDATNPVVMQNVELSQVVLNQGAFTLRTAAPESKAESGNTLLSYTTGISGITKGTTLTLLADLSMPEGSTAGLVDLEFVFTGFNTNLAYATGSLAGLKEAYGIEFGGILGNLLNQPEPVVAAETLRAGESSGATTADTFTVSYGAGTGAQVGSLVITIAGLNVPEPATSTLSLLALAALAARRRRK
ncbi:MAG: autotransporter-associated beta strand repeat-containing protein, partial [Akkermansia sp.]|nr:autotransporter-associated beta strand repeat-containing protein [Akkermansia sp.]